MIEIDPLSLQKSESTAVCAPLGPASTLYLPEPVMSEKKQQESIVSAIIFWAVPNRLESCARTRRCSIGGYCQRG